MAFSQDFDMTNGRVNTCSGKFYDSQGPARFLAFNQYRNNEDFTFTICPDNPSNRIHLRFSEFKVKDNDILCFYDGEDRNAPLLSCWDNTVITDEDDESETDFGRSAQATLENTSGCLTIHWESDGSGRARGWEADISCTFKCQQILADITATDPVEVPLDTGWINLCIGDTLTLTGAGSYPQSGNGAGYTQSDAQSEFEWDFGDGTTSIGQTITHVYTTPGGYTLDLTIRDQLGCVNSNFAQKRVRVAPPPIVNVSSVPELCIGDTLSLTASAGIEPDTSKTVTITPEEGGFESLSVRADSIALPDGEGVYYESPIRFNTFAPNQVIESPDDIVSLCVNMEHTWVRDLEIEIECPTGQIVLLHDFQGQEGNEVFLGEPIDNDNLDLIPGPGYTYCWTNEGVQTWHEFIDDNLTGAGQTLPEGDYRPFESLDGLVGCPINGEWIMRIKDLWLWDNGFIYWWSLEFDERIQPENQQSFIPQIVNYDWTGSDAVFNASDSMVLVAQTEGNSLYNLSFEDEFGCSYDAQVPITVKPLDDPSCVKCRTRFVDLVDSISVCEPGEMVDLELRTNPELVSFYDDFTFSWSPSEGLSCTDCPNPTLTLTNTNVYVVQVDNGEGCMLADTIFVEISNFTPLSIDNVTTMNPGCLGDGNGSIEFQINGGSGNVALQWSNGETGQTPSLENLMSGTYSVTVMDNNSCVQDIVESFTLVDATPVEITLSKTDLSCFGTSDGSIQTTITGGIAPYSIQWSNNQSLETIENLDAGVYSLTITDSNGCQAMDSIQVEAPSQVEVIVNAANPTCAEFSDGSIIFNVNGGNGPYSYQVQGEGQSTENVFLGLASGSFPYTVTDANGCTSAGTVLLIDPNPLTVEIITDSTVISLGTEIELTAITENSIGVLQFEWGAVPTIDSATVLSGSTLIDAPSQSTTYSVNVTDQNGCQASDNIFIEVDFDRSVAVPTAFTPNGDFRNDLLLVHGTSGTKVKMFKVFNRWGELLHQDGDFMVNDHQTGWDGSFRGEMMESDVYIWYLEVEYVDGFVKSYEGQTNLIR